MNIKDKNIKSFEPNRGQLSSSCRSGSFGWRDTLTPFQLLAKYCTLTGKELLLYKGDQPPIIKLDGATHPVRNQGKINIEA